MKHTTTEKFHATTVVVSVFKARGERRCHKTLFCLPHPNLTKWSL